jgi:ELWxxDGT repeat protein
MKTHPHYYKLLFVFIFLLGLNVQAQTFSVVKSISQPSAFSPDIFFTFNSKLFLKSLSNPSGIQLLESDGSTTGTIKSPLHDSVDGFGNQFTSIAGKLYFVGTFGSSEKRLMVSDGTVAGTKSLKKLTEGAFTSVHDFISFNNELFFTVYNSSNYYEIWTSDGTVGGTHILKGFPASAFAPNTSVGGGIKLTEYNGKLYFRADDFASGNEVWVTDGTIGGTQLFMDMNPFGDSYPADFFVYQGNLLFSVIQGNGKGLWKTDGTVAGTSMIKAFNHINARPPTFFKEVNGKACFVASDGVNGREPWVTDGTAGGTFMLKDISSDGFSIFGYPKFISFKGDLYFASGTTANSFELWKTDGTTVGTKFIKQISSRGQCHGLKSAVAYNDKLYLVIDTNRRTKKLWESDGTTQGTKIIEPVNAQANYDLSTTTMFKYGGELFFTGNFMASGNKLWKLTTAAPNSTSSVSNNVSFTVYPNPATNELNLRSETKISKLIILDILGMVVGNYSHDFNRINISNLTTGFYFLHIETEKGTALKRFVKRD